MILHNPFGPIFEKELRATSRRRRSYVLRVAYLGLLMLALLLAYMSVGDVGVRGGNVAMRVQRANQLGHSFFMAFSVFCVGAMAMIGPVLTCTAISAERLHKTLPVLLMTPITSWQIVTGKLFSRLLVALTLVGLSLPVLALVRLLGGVELWQMFGVVVVSSATAVATAAMGLLVSTFVSRAYVAILIGYAFVGVVYVFVPILVILAHINTGPPPMTAIRTISIISPFFNVAFQAAPFGPMMSTSWAWCAGAQLGLALLLVALSAAMLRRIQRREGNARGQVEPVAPEAAAQEENAGAGPHRRRARNGRAVGDNPVLWRELRRPVFSSKVQSFIAAGICVLFLAVVYGMCWSQGVLDDEELQFVFGCIFNGLGCLLVCVLAGTAIAQEKESDTWTLLLATPVSGRAIVFGKLLGVARRMLWPTVLVAAHFAAFALGGVISWLTVAFILWVMITFNALWAATGVYLSLRLRKVTFAVMINLGLVVALYVVLPIVLAILGELAGNGDDLVEPFLLGLPYFYIVESINEWRPHHRWSSLWLPLFGNVDSWWLLVSGLAAGAAYVLVAAGVVLYMLKRFNRIVARAEQAARIDAPESPVSQMPATA